MASTNAKRVITFDQERETKNKIRYQERTDGEAEAIGTLYVSKQALAAMTPPNPSVLKVTIEAGR